MSFDQSKATRRVGGPIRLGNGGRSVGLRVLVDHSLVEVFTEHGQALTTRVYQSGAPTSAGEAVYFFARGGNAVVRDVVAHEMSSVWRSAEDLPESWRVRDP